MLNNKEPFILVFHDAELQVDLSKSFSTVFHAHMRFMDINHYHSNDITKALSECEMAFLIPVINREEISGIWRDLIMLAKQFSAFSMLIMIDALPAVEIDDVKGDSSLWVLHCSMGDAIEWVKLCIALFCISNGQDLPWLIKDLIKDFSVNGTYRIAVADNLDDSCGLTSARQAITAAKGNNLCAADAVFFHIGYCKKGLFLQDVLPVCALIDDGLPDCYSVGWGYGQIPDLRDNEVRVLILWGSHNG